MFKLFIGEIKVARDYICQTVYMIIIIRAIVFNKKVQD